MDLNRCRIVGKYEISEMCLLTYPCQHYIKNTETKKFSRLTGDKIFCMLRDDGISDNHFNEYAEYIRKRDNPTPEELSEREAQRKKMYEMIEKQRKEKEELQKLTNTYKASSRLERLKSKNNITGNIFA